MDFTISIPYELLPALAAEFSIVQGSTSAATAQEYFAASVVETVRQRAELYQVGPYFVGAVEPRFLVDGRGNPAYTGPDAIPYVVVYPTANDGVDWVNGDQWTDPVTDIVYEFTDGAWAEPQPVVDGGDV
jgi:hypothetical protein